MNKKIINIMVCMLLIITLIPMVQATNQNTEADESQIKTIHGIFIGRKTVYNIGDSDSVQVVGWIFQGSNCVGKYRGPLEYPPFGEIQGYIGKMFVFITYHVIK